MKYKIRQKKKLLLQALRKNLGNISKACEAVGCARDTYYEYYNTDPEFRKACEENNEIIIDFVESKLFESINNGDTTATIFFLKTKGKHRGYFQAAETINYNITKEQVTIPASLLPKHDSEENRPEHT